MGYVLALVFFIGVAVGAFWNEEGLWPEEDTRNKVFHFFTKYERNRRRIGRLNRRIRKIDRLSDKKAKVGNQDQSIADLEQELANRAFSKPQEFLDTK